MEPVLSNSRRTATIPVDFDVEQCHAKFTEWQTYIGWDDDDARRVAAALPLLRGVFTDVVEAFYVELLRHDSTRKVITGGAPQVARLKESLHRSITALLEGPLDQDFVAARWKIGHRHVTIGLDQGFVAAAMSRVRTHLTQYLIQHWPASPIELGATLRSLHKLLDLDLMLLQDAYETQRLRHERLAARELSEHKFRQLVEAATCAVIMLDQSLRIEYFSPFAERITGFTAESAVGHGFCELLVEPQHRHSLHETLRRAYIEGGLRDRETQLSCRDGRQRWVLWNAQRVDNYDGQPSLLVVAHDTSEWRAAQERMLRSERLAGIGQMMAGLAHESRNALQRIRSLAEMLEMELEDNEAAIELVQRLLRAQDDLRRLFDELRNYSAPIQLDRSECLVASCWREAWELTRNARRQRQVELREFGEFDRLRARLDRFRLVQLFRNLFENALVACGDPVVIEVACREVSSGSGAWLELSVGDNGPGMTDEVRQKAFDPFFTTRSKGTGLGLAITRRIVDAHGGSISIDSQPGRGARFTIAIPQVEA